MKPSRLTSTVMSHSQESMVIFVRLEILEVVVSVKLSVVVHQRFETYEIVSSS